MTIAEFKVLVQRDGARLFRPMPWRELASIDAYHILVSEMMLQQTQVSRVIPKFQEFLRVFPTVEALAAAPLAGVLQSWSGLGYNRRARYLHEAAKQLAGRPQPWSYDDLVACKGIGLNTAQAVLVYSYNQPGIFIETNIRTVYIHYFFEGVERVPDKAVLDLLGQTLDRAQPRRFYWALMDIGAALKARGGNAAKRAAGYKKQARFNGSLRQIRGAVLRELATSPLTAAQFSYKNDNRLPAVLESLTKEGLIHIKAAYYHLGSE